MTQQDNKFDYSDALKAIQEGNPLSDVEEILTPLISKLTEAGLKRELDSDLGREVRANRRKGKAGTPQITHWLFCAANPS